MSRTLPKLFQTRETLPTPEVRQRVVDAGAYFLAIAYGSGDYRGVTPSALSNVAEGTDSAPQLAREARYLARSCSLYEAFLRVMAQSAIPRVNPEGVTEPALKAWRRYWKNTASEGGLRLPEWERLCFREALITGEIFVTQSAQGWRAICGDVVETGETQDGAFIGVRVFTWKVGGRVYRGDAVGHIALRTDPASPRGRSCFATSLGSARALTSSRSHAGTGMIARSKIVSTVEAQAPSTLLPSAGGLGGTGLEGDDIAETVGMDAETKLARLPAGSLPLLEAGQKLQSGEVKAPIDSGFVYELKCDIAAGVGISLNRLEGIAVDANFARMRESARRDRLRFEEVCEWWAMGFRSLLWADAMMEAVANGEVSAVDAQAEPIWLAPYIEPPQPEAEAKALKTMDEVGLLDREAERQRRGMRPASED